MILHAPGFMSVAYRVRMVSLSLASLIPLLDSLEEVVWVRRPSGEYIFINKSFETIYGVSRDALAEDPLAWLENVAPEDLPHLRRRFAGKEIVDPVEVEWALEYSNGLRRKVRSRLLPLHGPDGFIVAIAGFTEDRTRSSRAAELMEAIGRAHAQRDAALHQSDVYRETLDRITDGFFAVDADWNLLYVNCRFEQLVGRSYRETVGRNLWDLFPEARETIFYDECVQALERNSTTDFVAHFAPLSAWYHTRAYPSEHGLSVFFRDITERRRLQEELVKVAAEERKRIGGELHDSVGQKLTGATFMLQALEARLEQGTVIEGPDLARIREVLADATSTTHRISRGLFPTELADQPLASAFEQLARDVEVMFDVQCYVVASQGIRLALEPALHLFRLIQELVTNAIKHGSASDISIALSAEGPRGRASICYKGIPSSRDWGEEGLGLRLVAYRLDLLGGAMKVQEEGDEGTCIICSFPLDHRP